MRVLSIIQEEVLTAKYCTDPNIRRYISIEKSLNEMKGSYSLDINQQVMPNDFPPCKFPLWQTLANKL